MVSDGAPRPGLRKLAKNRRFDELEAACLEDIGAGEVDKEELVSALTLASHRAEPEKVDALLWVSVTSWSEAYGNAAAIDLARDLAPLSGKGGSLKDEVIELYRSEHADAPGIDALLGRLLVEGGESLADAITYLDALLALPPGACFRERAGKVVGRSVKFDETSGSLDVEMEGRQVSLPRAEVLKLVPLDGQDFRALAAFDAERLRELAGEDPARLCEMVLRAYGPKLAYRELRAHLSDLVPGAWPAWWNSVRPAVSRSPWIEVSTAAQPALELRKKPLDHDERVRRELRETETPFERFGVVLDYLEQAGEHAGEEGELLRELAGVVTEGIGAGGDSVAWSGHAVLRELSRTAGKEFEAPPAPEPDNPLELFARIDDPRLERLVLELVCDRRPDDWPEVLAKALPACAPEAGEEGVRRLVAAGRTDRVLEAAQVVMGSVSRFPASVVWLYKEAGKGGHLADSDALDRVQLLCRVIQGIDRTWKLPPAERQVSTRLRSVLTGRNFETARSVLASIDNEQARQVRETLIRCIEISDDFRAKISDLLVETHPRLFAKDLPPWENEEIIYTSAEGLDRKRKELDELVTVVLPGIADAIGVAAAEGDLSENAEYIALLEKRQRMTERANSLQAELAMVRVLYPEMVGEKAVSVGSRVRVKDVETGEERAFSFLGPWDVDFEGGVYSYRADFSRAFMGRRVGDTVEVSLERMTRTYEIREIGCAVK